jgi:cell division protein FtsZ
VEPAASDEKVAAVTPLRTIPSASAPPAAVQAPTQTASAAPPAAVQEAPAPQEQQAAQREAPLSATRAVPPAPAAGPAFVPPPPVAAGSKSAAAPAQPDPFRAADLLNGGAQTKTSRPSLFARVTSGGLLRKETPEPELRRELVAAKPAPARPAPAPEQPRLEGVDRAERRTAAPAEEDLLDIPAFLRRQAN